MATTLTPELRLFLQHKDQLPANVQEWPLPARLCLLTGGTIRLFVNVGFITMVPKFALMAVSPKIMTVLVHSPNQTFWNWTSQDMTIGDPQTRITALEAFAFWLKALCTSEPVSLIAPTVASEIVLRRFLHETHMDLYTIPMIERLVHPMTHFLVDSDQGKAIAHSCSGPDDPLLNKLGAAVVDEMIRLGSFEVANLVFRVYGTPFKVYGDPKHRLLEKEVDRVLRESFGQVWKRANKEGPDRLVDVVFYDYITRHKR
jgi:hypothetical protein